MPSNSTALTTPDGIAALYGSFWVDTYADRSQPLAIAAGVAELAKQYATDTNEVIASVSRNTIEPYHNERWYPLTLRTSELNATTGAILHFGAGAKFGVQDDGSSYYFGIPTQNLYKFPLPDGVINVTHICNRINNPSKCWIIGLDAIIVDGLIVFKDNPLLDDAVTKDTLPLDGDPDIVARLWLCNAQFDRHDVYTQFGFIHDLEPSLDSTIQKDGMLAISRSIVGGTSDQTLRELIAAGTGIGCTLTTETVIDTVSTTQYEQVITDNKVYTLPAGATVSVKAGDILAPGTFVSDDVVMASFSQDTVPDWLLGLVLVPGITSPAFAERLILLNTDVALTVTTVAGYPRMSFYVGADQETADAFFDEIHARGVASGKTAIQYIIDAYGYQPPTINPLQFFITNWFRGTLLIIRMTNKALNASRWLHLKHLQRLTPPDTLLILLPEISCDNISIPATFDNVSTFPMTTPIEFSTPLPVGSMRLSRIVSGV